MAAPTADELRQLDALSFTVHLPGPPVPLEGMILPRGEEFGNRGRAAPAFHTLSAHQAMLPNAARVAAMDNNVSKLLEQMEEQGPAAAFDPKEPLAQVDAADRHPGDVNAGLAHQIQDRNDDVRKTPTLKSCRSALTAQQHRHYRVAVEHCLNSAEKPRATSELPHLSGVVNIVNRERAQFLKRFREYVIGIEAGGGDGWNHNFLMPEVDGFAKRWLEARQTEEQAWRAGLGSSEVSVALMPSDVKKGAGIGAYLGDVAGAPGAAGKTSSVPTQLDVSALRSAPLVVGAEQISSDDTIVAAARKKAKYDGPIVVTTRASFVALCCETLASSSSTSGMFLPVDVAGQGVLHLRRPPLVSSSSGVSRRELSAAASEALINYDASFSQGLVGPVRTAVVVQMGGQPVVLELDTWRKADERSKTAPALHFRLVKMEYSTKPGSRPMNDDSSGVYREEFSPAEAIELFALLQAVPKSTAVVYRVNAYNGAILGVETFTQRTFVASLASTSLGEQVRGVWDRVGPTVASLAQASAAASQSGSSWVLSRQPGSVDLSLEQQAPTGSFTVEADSLEVAKREYLKPIPWKSENRVCFTFDPRK